MKIHELIYNIVDNPKSIQNYIYLKNYYSSDENIAESIEILIRKKNDNSNPIKQDESA